MTAKLTPQGKKAAGAANPPGKGKNKPKKPKKPANPVVVCIIVFVLLLGGAGAALYFNLGGAAEKVLMLLPAYKTSLIALDKQKADLATAQAAAQDATDKAASDAKANTKAAADLKTQQDQLAADKKAFEDTKGQAKTALESQKAMADVYTNLDAAVAAAMLLKAPSTQEAAKILKLLPQDKAAEIIAAIEASDAKTAYDIAKLIGQ